MSDSGGQIGGDCTMRWVFDGDTYWFTGRCGCYRTVLDKEPRLCRAHEAEDKLNEFRKLWNESRKTSQEQSEK